MGVCPAALTAKTGFVNNDHVAGYVDEDDDDDLDDDDADDDDDDTNNNVNMVWQNSASRGSCDTADLIEHSGGWSSEKDVQKYAEHLGAKMYTVSFDKDRKKKEAWFCAKDNWATKDS